MAEPSVRVLVARLIDDGKAYAQAELALVKATASAWIAPAKLAVPLFVVAIFVVQAALTVLVAALGMALVTWLGVAGGLAVGAVIALLIAGGLAWFAATRFRGVGR